MPPEWAPHRATWLAWPYDEETFPDRVENVEKALALMIAALQDSEQIELLVLDADMKNRASALIDSAGAKPSAVNFHIAEYADIWLRDSGPIFVKDKMNNQVITEWNFNAWGNKFPELLIDRNIPGMISGWTNTPLFKADIVLEGGAIEVNGQGVCLTTEQCLLNDSRNLGASKDEIERNLQDYLGITRTIWLKEGLTNDHTDGHIDELARFVSDKKIVCAYEDDVNDENYEILRDNYTTITMSSDGNDECFEIVKLPMPHMYYENGEKAPVSYTNFYIANKVVLAPLFKDKNDSRALNILKECFPEKRVTGIDCSDIIYGGGAIHCITQQEPK